MGTRERRSLIHAGRHGREDQPRDAIPDDGGDPGGNSKPELMVRRYRHGAGLRFRLFAKDPPGRPDVVLPRWNALVLVHGCFWHGHRGCRYFRFPKTRPEWWAAKIEANATRAFRQSCWMPAGAWRLSGNVRCGRTPIRPSRPWRPSSAATLRRPSSRRDGLRQSLMDYRRNLLRQVGRHRVTHLLALTDWRAFEQVIVREGLQASCLAHGEAT